MWESIGDFIVYECAKCGNDTILDPWDNPPKVCSFCSGEKVSKDAVIKYLAEKLNKLSPTCPLVGGTAECPYESCKPNTDYKCWIAYAEEQVKNGT